MGPFSTPPFNNFQLSHIGLVPRKHSNKFRMIFHLSYLKSGTPSINYFIEKDPLTMPSQKLKTLARAASWEKQTESAFRLIPVFWECSGMGSIILTGCSQFGLALLRTSLTNCMLLSLSDATERILLNRCPISLVCHNLDDFLIVETPCTTPPLDALCWASLSSIIVTLKLWIFLFLHPQPRDLLNLLSSWVSY